MDAALLQAAGIETVVCDAAGAGTYAEVAVGRLWNRSSDWRKFSPAPHSHIGDSRRARPNPDALPATINDSMHRIWPGAGDPRLRDRQGSGAVVLRGRDCQHRQLRARTICPEHACHAFSAPGWRWATHKLVKPLT